MTSSQTRQRHTSPVVPLLIGVVPALAIVLASSFELIGMDSARYLFLGTLIWFGIFAFVSWRKLDDPSREAYKFASFWGAGTGLVLGGLVMFAFVAFPDEASGMIQRSIDTYIAEHPSLASDPGLAGYYLGIASLVGVQLCLFALAWFGWWAFQRFGARSD